MTARARRIQALFFAELLTVTKESIHVCASLAFIIAAELLRVISAKCVVAAAGTMSYARMRGEERFVSFFILFCLWRSWLRFIFRCGRTWRQRFSIGKLRMMVLYSVE